MIKNENMHIYGGIDPGKTGGVVFLDENGGVVFSCVTPLITNKKGKTEYNVQEMVNALQSFKADGSQMFLCIENVHAMPGQGVTSMFSFGRGLGLWEGIVAALRIPTIMVRPQEWQKDILMGLKAGNTKQASAIFCSRRWPSDQWTATERSRVPHTGLTDAACLALYGMKTQRKMI
jgi:crossover junction endodeoxyribonuclease RuvC